MARPLALGAAALAASLLAVSGAGGANAAQPQTPKRGGTLVFRMIGSEPPCLNILSELCVTGPLFTIADTVLLEPFETGPDFTNRPRLAMATFTRRRPFTLTYRIRPEARWSDGVPITARDFVFTLQAIRRYGRPDLRELHRVVRIIRVVDAKTFRVVLKPKSSSWQGLFGNVLPEHALRGADLSKVWSTNIDNPKTGEPIGSGPFLVESWERGHELVLRRNPRYWGPHAPFLGRLEIQFVPTLSDPTTELRAGELDLSTGIAPDAFPGVRRLPGIRFTATAGPAFEHLELQFGPDGHPALRNKLVRQALAYGIDRVALVRQVYGTIDPAVRPLDSSVLAAQSPYYGAAWSSYRYRPARARALLEQAGCRRGDDGIYSCSGKRLSLRFVTTAGDPLRARALSLMQQQLREAGIEVVPVFEARSAFFTQILPGGTFDAALFNWGFGPGTSWLGVYGCGGSQNYTGYCQRLVTADLFGADRTLDAEQQARVLNRADSRMVKDVPVIPLYQRVLTAARRADVRDYVLNPSNPLWNAEDWWLDR